MNTQNTPVHPRLWHREFWFLAFADLLLTMSVYLFIPVLPLDLQAIGFCSRQVAVVMGAYALGIFSLGPFCNWLIQRYRRNHLFEASVVLMAVDVFLTMKLPALQIGETLVFPVFVGLRFFLGAFFGLAQMVLTSTLIIDVCESFQRTEANHSAGWFARFSLSLGPMLALVLHPLDVPIDNIVCWLSLGLMLVVLLLISVVEFPFKTPDEGARLLSLDRFFLPEGWALFLNLFCIMLAAGMVMALPLSSRFFAMMMLGFFLALLAERFAFADAEIESQVVSGLILLAVAWLIMLFRAQAGEYITPTLMGMGIGLMGSRFLLFFVKLSRHCQRGTSQSTFFAAWESGIGMGLFAGWMLNADRHIVLEVCLLLVCASFVFYRFFVHRWFLRHKNR